MRKYRLYRIRGPLEWWGVTNPDDHVQYFDNWRDAVQFLDGCLGALRAWRGAPPEQKRW